MFHLNTTGLNFQDEKFFFHSEGCSHPFHKDILISKGWSHPIHKGRLTQSKEMVSSNSKGCSQSISKGWMVSSIQNASISIP
jgi:hypothetical protein